MGRPAAAEAAQRMIWSVILVLSGIKKMCAADCRLLRLRRLSLSMIFHESAAIYRYRSCHLDP